jgi:hypothetical protein
LGRSPPLLVRGRLAWSRLVLVRVSPPSWLRLGWRGRIPRLAASLVDAVYRRGSGVFDPRHTASARRSSENVFPRGTTFCPCGWRRRDAYMLWPSADSHARLMEPYSRPITALWVSEARGRSIRRQ